MSVVGFESRLGGAFWVWGFGWKFFCWSVFVGVYLFLLFFDWLVLCVYLFVGVYLLLESMRVGSFCIFDIFNLSRKYGVFMILM